MSYLKFSRGGGMKWLPAPRYYVDKIYTPEEKKKLRDEQVCRQYKELCHELSLNEQQVKAYMHHKAETHVVKIAWNNVFGYSKKRTKI
jgi:hypothetical protein